MAETVLLVEDDRATRLHLRRTLEKAGYSVLTTGDGAEALELLEGNLPDLVLTDWMMPGMDGPELVRALRAEPRTEALYVIMLTVRSERDDTVMALDLGADDFVGKPFDPRELLARIRAGLRIRRLQAQVDERTARLERTVDELEQALAEVQSLQDLLPICAWCNKVRDDEAYWHTLESYLAARAGVRFTHGICPDCRDEVLEKR